MTALVVGATGATGRLLVAQLLQRQVRVRALVRSAEGLPADLRAHPHLEILTGAILDFDDSALERLVEGCEAVGCCLGHPITVKGIFLPPRRLVTDATSRLCNVLQNRRSAPVRFVLMNTTGNRNRDLDEPRTLAERLVIGALRVVLPPQADNEDAAEFLRSHIGPTHPVIEWAAVRPDTLIDEETVRPYSVHSSPNRSPIFNAGKTSRIAVAHFMADLMTDSETWAAWKGRMPVVYRKM